MKDFSRIGALLVIALIAASGTPALAKKCPPDSVKVGQVCVDTYEASVWQIPATNTSLITKVQKGKAVLADLTAGGATEIMVGAGASGPIFPPTFPANGNWTAPVYAVSITGVEPTGCVTWFQAAQACRLSGKRLLTNAEWQDAAAGTADPGGSPGPMDCNTNGFLVPDIVVNTGSRTNCKSSWGVFDMVGNLAELVADWVPLSTACPGWGGFSSDAQCFAGADTVSTRGPGVLYRGSDYHGGGIFSINSLGSRSPSEAETPACFVGFRCGRNL